MFFYEIKGHTQKLSSFGRVKKIRPKKSLRLDMSAPLQLLFDSLNNGEGSVFIMESWGRILVFSCTLNSIKVLS